VRLFFFHPSTVNNYNHPLPSTHNVLTYNHHGSTIQKGPSFINLDVFNQILDMDDDEDGDEEEAFSEGIVGGFFDQAETTFASMEKAL
jgi:hypothetical protein